MLRQETHGQMDPELFRGFHVFIVPDRDWASGYGPCKRRSQVKQSMTSMLRVASSRRTMIASGGLLVLGSGLVASQQYAHSEAQQKASWESTLEKSLPAVVALKMSTPCAFDTFAPGCERIKGAWC